MSCAPELSTWGAVNMKESMNEFLFSLVPTAQPTLAPQTYTQCKLAVRQALCTMESSLSSKPIQ